MKFTPIQDQTRQDHTRKLKRDPKLILLIILMLLVISQVIVLLANSGFINRTPEPVTQQTTVIEQPVTVKDIKTVNADLNKVIKDLNETTKNPDLKDDHVVTEKNEIKPAPIVPVPAPAMAISDKELVKPEQSISENKKIALSEKPPAIIMPAAISSKADIVQVIEKPAVEVNTVTEIKPAYIKHDSNGNLLEDHSEQWACVHDTRSGLMWEVKSKDDAMRNSNNLYSWFDPETSALKGTPDGGRCKGDSDCDTSSYIQAMNKQNFCGYNDWRLPTRKEMLMLVSYGNDDKNIKIDTSYFPEALPSWYWTASSNTSRPEFAWYVLFTNGIPLNDLKENPKHIRLVRSESSS